MRITLTILASAFALVATAPVSAPAQGPQGRGWGAGLDTTGLGLTADQQAKWKAIREDLQAKNAPLREQMRQAAGGKSYRDLSDAEREALRPKVQPIIDQMRDNARKAMEQAAALLTPDQKKKFEARMRERMEHAGGPPN